MDRKNWTGHELRRLAIVLVLGLGVFSHSRTARADEDLQLKLVWVNTATEFPLAFDLMAGEVGFIFAGMEVEVVWSDRTSALLDQEVPDTTSCPHPDRTFDLGTGRGDDGCGAARGRVRSIDLHLSGKHSASAGI